MFSKSSQSSNSKSFSSSTQSTTTTLSSKPAALICETKTSTSTEKSVSQTSTQKSTSISKSLSPKPFVLSKAEVKVPSSSFRNSENNPKLHDNDNDKIPSSVKKNSPTTLKQSMNSLKDNGTSINEEANRVNGKLVNGVPTSGNSSGLTTVKTKQDAGKSEIKSILGNSSQSKNSTNDSLKEGLATNQGSGMRKNPLVPAPSMGRNLVHLIHGEPNKSNQNQSNQPQNGLSQKNQIVSNTSQSSSLITSPKLQNRPNGTQNSEDANDFQKPKDHVLEKSHKTPPSDPISDYENLYEIKSSHESKQKSTHQSDTSTKKGREERTSGLTAAFVVEVERKSTSKVSHPN